MKLVSIHKLSLLLVVAWAMVLRVNAQQVWSLEQCVDSTLHHNLTLEAAKVGRKLGTLRSEEAQALRLPRVTIGADYKYFTNLPYQLLPLSVFNGPEGAFKEAQFGVPHNLGLAAQAAWPVYNPQLKSAQASALLGERLLELQKTKAEEQLLMEVTGLYYTAQLLRQQVVFLDSNLLNTTKLLENLHLLKAQGLAKATDVSRTVLQQAQLRTQRDMLLSQQEQTKNGLKWLMGLSLDASFEVEAVRWRFDEADPTPRPTTDWQITQIKQELVQAEYKRLGQSRLPVVSLVANYGLTGFGYGQGPTPFLKFFPIGFVGMQASYALWDAPTGKKMAQKKVELQQNTLLLKSMEAQSNMEVTNARLKRSSMMSQVTHTLKQIELADAVYKETRLQQQQGLATLTDILLADTALRETQQGYLAAVTNYLRADLELKKAAARLRE